MELLKFAKQLHDECIRLSSKIIFDRKHPRQLYLIGFYVRLIELSGCIITLIEKNHGTGVPLILRTIFETYIEIKNLHSEVDYIKHMEARHCEDLINTMKSAKSGQNPYLEKISKLKNLDTEIDNYEATLKSFNENGYKSLAPHERFKKADMKVEYYSIYYDLCGDAHSNVSALIKRNFEVNVDNDLSVVCYKDEPPESFLVSLDTTAGLLTDATEKIHEFFKTGLKTDAEKLSEKLNEIRKINILS